jgi:hypothetical protein
VLPGASQRPAVQVVPAAQAEASTGKPSALQWARCPSGRQTSCSAKTSLGPAMQNTEMQRASSRPASEQ